jgi:hypothetical protein
MLEQRGYGLASASSTQRATTYTRRPYFRPASGLPFGPAKRAVCHHPARPGEMVVARFSPFADPMEIRRAAEEDRERAEVEPDG